MVASFGSWRAAVNNFFIVFVHHLNRSGAPTMYRGTDRKIAVYNTRPEAEAAAAELTAANENPNLSFTVTEFQRL
jgi:hypothetical protein